MSKMVHITNAKELRVFNAWDKEKYAEYLKRPEESGVAAYAVRVSDSDATWASLPRGEYEEMKRWERERKNRERGVIPLPKTYA